MKYLLTAFSILCCITFLSGQSYNTAGGLRIGSGIGLTAVQRVANKTTVEGILNSQFAAQNVKISVLARQHAPIFFKRFNVYAGAGLHKTWYTDNNPDTKNPYGVSFAVGGEITISRINISYDYKPSFNVQGGAKVFENETALSVRYVLWKRPTKMQKRRKARKKSRAKKKKQKAKQGNDGNWFGKLFKRG